MDMPDLLSMTRAELENACDERDVICSDDMSDRQVIGVLFDYFLGLAEKQQEASDQAYYGGD